MDTDPHPLLTLEEYARLPDPDDGHDDLIAGKRVIRPFHSIGHGLACGNLCGVLGVYRKRAGGSASVRCGLVISRDPDTVAGPDVSFWRDRSDIPLVHGWPTRAPDAAFDVVDAGEPYPDVMQRVRMYLGFGIRVLWLVDPFGRTVTEFVGRAVRLLDESESIDGDVLPGFSCRVADLFG